MLFNKLLFLFIIFVFASINSFANSSLKNVSPIGNTSKGKILSKTCVACHGTTGNSTTDAFPKIAGQHASYLLKQLIDFKQKNRNNALMAGIVAPLTLENMVDLAAFFATQSSVPNVAKKDKKLIALGQQLYRGGSIEKGIPACAACHGSQGKGIASAKFPAIATQHPAYTALQLKAFRQFSVNLQFSDSKKPARENDANNMMRSITAKLSDVEINALAQYIAGLH